VSIRYLTLCLFLLIAASGAAAESCATEDYERYVSGTSGCLLLRRFGATDPEAMIVWLHGDVSSGGPANYHFAIAERATRELAPARILSVALVRPGYPDGSGESSSVSPPDVRRFDHYTKENVSEVGMAIERLKAHFKPKTVVLVGHSGGAATGAILLGLRPGLVNAAVLVACPCELVAWRNGRPGAKQWPRSENPMSWIDSVDVGAKVVTITGSSDDNTPPALAQSYVDALRLRKVDAQSRTLFLETHNSAFRSSEVLEALRRVLPSQ